MRWSSATGCSTSTAPDLPTADRAAPTPLNASLLNGTPRGQEFLLRTPLKRYGRTEELAGAAIFLSSDAASYVNGEVIAVDGGFLASGVNQ